MQKQLVEKDDVVELAVLLSVHWHAVLAAPRRRPGAAAVP